LESITKSCGFYFRVENQFKQCLNTSMEYKLLDSAIVSI
jgi:hypothetical protein